MPLPFGLPTPLAQARPIETLPEDAGGAAAEPKLDGWRVALDTERGHVFGRSGTNLTDRFSDIAAVARDLKPAIIDGELLALNSSGHIEFAKIQSRGSRGPRPREPFTIILAAFDILAHGTEDLRPQPYSIRRRRLQALLAESTPLIRPVPMTHDLADALSWLTTAGVEGVVLKPDTPYRPRFGSGWVKWRRRHTIDLIVVGVTASTPTHQALVLAQPDAVGRLRTVGVSLPVSPALRSQIAPLLHPAGDLRELPEVVAGLPGRSARVRYMPVRPQVVVEVQADQASPSEFGRFRHNPRPVRIRADLTPDQVAPTET